MSDELLARIDALEREVKALRKNTGRCLTSHSVRISGVVDYLCRGANDATGGTSSRVALTLAVSDAYDKYGRKAGKEIRRALKPGKRS